MLRNMLSTAGMIEKHQPEEFVYIFLHIQKCAGRTIMLHALNQFGEKKVFHDGLFTAQLYKQYGEGPRTLILTANRDEPFMKKPWFYDTLRQVIPEAKRERIRLIGGHRAFYGMHALFEKPARYFVFVRDPVKRLISWYNNLRRLSVEHQYLLQAIRDDGTSVPFEEWLERINLAAHSMTAFLALRYQGEQVFDFDFVPTQQDFEHAKALLDRMYFVGLTDSDADKDFIYQRLGITQFISNQNVGKEQSAYFTPDDYEAVKQMILSKCPFDQELYEYAKALNTSLRSRIGDYKRAIAYTRFRKDLGQKARS